MLELSYDCLKDTKKDIHCTSGVTKRVGCDK